MNVTTSEPVFVERNVITSHVIGIVMDSVPATLSHYFATGKMLYLVEVYPNCN